MALKLKRENMLDQPHFKTKKTKLKYIIIIGLTEKKKNEQAPWVRPWGNRYSGHH